MTERQSLCYVLAYRNPHYVRTVSLVRALRTLDYDVTTVINRRSGLLRYVEVPLRLLLTRLRDRPDVYILGFRGHEIFVLVRLITLGRPLIFDSLLSPTESLIAEKKQGRPGGVAGRILQPLERQILRSSSVVLTDTEAHCGLLSERFGLASRKVHAVPIGAFDDRYARRDPGTPFRVLFYATMIPLHGMDTVTQAIRVLDSESQHAEAPEWRIIGGSAESLPATARHSSWVDITEIVESEIPLASLGMGGPFGVTAQAQRVVTGKTVQFMASGLPVLVANSPAHAAAGFIDRTNCLMSQPGDAQSVVDAIRWAMDNPQQLEEIGTQGRQLYLEKFSDRAIADALTGVLISL